MNLVYRTMRGLTRLFHKVYSRWQIIGYEKLPRTGPVIVAANHVSYLDPNVIGGAIMRECAFMARHDLWDRKWLAWLLPRLGTFPVHRGQPDRAAIRRCLEALERGLVLVIFPEGGRSDDGTLQRAEPGVALIVQKSGAPVVPVAVVGTEKMLPVGASKLKRGRIKLVFGDPLFFTPDSSREEVLRGIMHAIAALLTEYGIPTTAKEDSPDTGSRV